MKREPYVITQNLSVQEIVELVKRAYDEGYTDGKADSTPIDWGKIATPWITPTPGVQPNISPNITPVTHPTDEWWKTPTIYCSQEDIKTTLQSENRNISENTSKRENTNKSAGVVRS